MASLITASTLFALTSSGLLLWIIVLARMKLMRVGSQTVRDGCDLPAPPDGWPRLSIVVPVHNEQDMIERCAASLRAQTYDDLELIFVLDRCSDNTAGVLAGHAATDPRVTIVVNDHCPDDWAGKCHAAHLGAQRATGEWILFTDADTEFEPDLTRAAVALARHRDAALLSLLSTLTFVHHFEQVAQLAAAIQLMIMYPIERVKRGRQARPFANGQFMLFRRDWYDRIGGHAAVKDDLLEDIASARRVQGHGGRSEVLFADGMLSCSMYETLRDFEQGWKRIFIEACNRKPGRLLKWATRTLLLGVALPLVQLAALVAAPATMLIGHPWLGGGMAGTVLTSWILQGVALRRLATLARAPHASIALYPLGCLIVGRIMIAGARDLRRRRPVVWGGRRYVLTPR